MPKKHIHILIDFEDYIQLSTKKVNISGLVCKLIKCYIGDTIVETDKEKLQKDIDKTENKIQELKQDISIKRMQIFRIEEEEEKEIEEKDKKSMEMTQALLNSGILRDVGGN